METNVHSLEERCSDNQRDNDSETSRAHVNYLTNLSISDKAATCAARRKRQQLELRKCKSDSNVRRRSEIDKMGSRISRSRSFDNLETDSIVYASLMARKLSLESCDASDDDYKLLESSDERSDVDDNHYATNINFDCDGHDTAENRSSIIEAGTNCIQQPPPTPRVDLTSAGNEIENDLLCKKYSTLPRVNFKNGNLDHEQFSRRSAPYKSCNSRAHVNVNVKTANTSEAPNNSDKSNDFTSFRSTTLPKTRSRLSEPFSRHSLRRAIDLTIPRKHFRISDASEHSAAIIPASNESTSGTGENVMRI